MSVIIISVCMPNVLDMLGRPLMYSFLNATIISIHRCKTIESKLAVACIMHLCVDFHAAYIYVLSASVVTPFVCGGCA